MVPEKRWKQHGSWTDLTGPEGPNRRAARDVTHFTWSRWTVDVSWYPRRGRGDSGSFLVLLVYRDEWLKPRVTFETSDLKRVQAAVDELKCLAEQWKEPKGEAPKKELS